MDNEESLLLYLALYSVDLFSEMKNDRKNILSSIYEKCSSPKEVLELILQDFYSFFVTDRDSKNIGYMVFYYMFQSFYFSDPDNYFLFDEDFFQTLIVNTTGSFLRFLNLYFSHENLRKVNDPINSSVFVVRNFSRTMTLEFQNLKRVMKTEVKKPCSQYSNLSENYYEVFNKDTIEILDYPSFDIEDIRKIYE
mgnify:FL=1